MSPSALALACAIPAAHIPTASSPCAAHQAPVAGARLDKVLLCKMGRRGCLKACSRPFDKSLSRPAFFARLPAQQGDGAARSPLLAPTHMRTTRERMNLILAALVFAPPLCGRSTNLGLNAFCAAATSAL